MENQNIQGEKRNEITTTELKDIIIMLLTLDETS